MAAKSKIKFIIGGHNLPKSRPDLIGGQGRLSGPPANMYSTLFI
jgi:hypothetical protein